MQVYLMSRQKQKEGSDYPTTYFSVCGIGMVGSFIPIRARYFGNAGKGAGEEAEEETEETKETKDAKKDVNYGARVEVLQMFSGNQETGETRDPVNLVAKKASKGGNKDGEVYYLECGRDLIPIEVPDFSTEERPDYRYAGNCRKLKALSTLLA